MKLLTFFYRLRRRITLILRGVSIRDKAKLMCSSVLWFLAGTKLPVISTLSPRVANIMVNGAVIWYKGLKYRLIDYSTAYYFSDCFEPWMWNYFKVLETDDIFVDVGAHIGLYSIYAASILRRGKVIAVEPHPENFNFLLSNVKLNNLRNVIALKIAAWEKNTELPLYVADSSDEHTIRPLTNFKRAYIVKARKLDDVLRELSINKVSFIKIDVEGAEVEVLKGLCNTLKGHRPRLIVESWASNTDAVQQILKDLNYSISIVPGSITKDFQYICVPK